MVTTCTIWLIQSKLVGKRVKMLTAFPFCILTFLNHSETEKEIVLYIFKLYLNTRMMFEPIMKQARKDGDDCFLSISVFMLPTQYYKGANRLYNLCCFSRKCKEYKNVTMPSFTCENSSQLVRVGQFKIVQSKYKKVEEVRQRGYLFPFAFIGISFTSLW